MFQSMRNNDALSRPHFDNTIAELDAEPTPPNHEELVLLVMTVPGKLALHFDK